LDLHTAHHNVPVPARPQEKCQSGGNSGTARLLDLKRLTSGNEFTIFTA
jgi:hypothetical protein